MPDEAVHNQRLDDQADGLAASIRMDNTSTRATVSSVLWLACLVASIVTSRILLTSHFQYPLHLLLAHLTILQLWETMQWFIRPQARRRHTASSNMRSFILWCLRAALLSILRSAMLISGYKSMMLWDNFTSLVMIMSLDWQPGRLWASLWSRDLRLLDVVRYLAFAIGTSLIYLYDSRIQTVGRNMSLAFLAFDGMLQMTQHLFATDLRSWPHLESIDAPCWEPNWQVYIMIPIWIYASTTEPLRPDSRDLLAPSAFAILINVLSTLGAIHLDPWKPQFSEELQPRSPPPVLSRTVTTRRAETIALAGAAALTNSLLVTASPRLSVLQLCGYGMALMAFCSPEDIKHFVQLSAERLLSNRVNENHLRTKAFALLLIMISSWSMVLIESTTLRLPAPDYDNLRLDSSFEPSTDLEIVVNRFAEPASDLSRDLRDLISTTAFGNLRTRITIYNKNTDSTQFRADLKQNVLDTDQLDVHVVALDNVGREGAAYLHHIYTKWDALARHTLFMQAKMADFDLARNRIEKFFVAETGFLSLSYQGVMCENCETCHDGYWTEDAEIVKGLYSRANFQRDCRDIVLTYRGQFLVSAARVRGNERAMFQQLLEQMEDSESPIHSPGYTQSKWHRHQNDTLNYPIFGFTLERMWGTLMQCTGLRVGHYSPSLLSTAVRPNWPECVVPADMAQCLDRRSGA